VSYRALDSTTVVDYLRSQPTLADVIPATGPLHASEVGDGNLNQVFIVRSAGDSGADRRGQAGAALSARGGRIVAADARADALRDQALLKHNELAPGLAPQVYHFDDAMSLVVMENLSGLEVMRKPLVARQRFPNFADHISTFLARTLFFTSDLYLTGPEKKLSAGAVHQPAPLRDSREVRLHQPLHGLARKQLESAGGRRRAGGAPQQRAQAGARRNEGRLHDRRPGAHPQRPAHRQHHGRQPGDRVIDPEFAFFGPMGFDVGAVLENLVLNYLAHFAHTPDPAVRAEYQAYLLDLVREIWTQFAAKFDALWLAEPRGELMPAAYWAYPGGADAFAEFRRRYAGACSTTPRATAAARCCGA
jgi:5-methylthioribose kinase